MDIRVLGPVEASAGGKPVLVGGGKPRALLALLALNAGSTIATDRLVEGLWGEQPPATAAKMVQLYVSQLRKALADGGDGAEIVTRGRGYELRLGGGELDARRSEQLVAAGAARDALTLWRGAPLADVADEPFAAAEIRQRRAEGVEGLLRVSDVEDIDLAVGLERDVLARGLPRRSRRGARGKRSTMSSSRRHLPRAPRRCRAHGPIRLGGLRAGGQGPRRQARLVAPDVRPAADARAARPRLEAAMTSCPRRNDVPRGVTSRG